jgi:nucleoside-diphosphate-sugar epimerase
MAFAMANDITLQPFDLECDFRFTPKITLREGLRKFAEWYKEYNG